jgi:VWFA-related protein
MKKKIQIILIIWVLFQLNLSSGPIALLGQQKTVQKPLEYEVTVALKLIQVFVTDKNGEPVMSLTKDDFRLFEDGKEVNIAAFEKHLLPQFRGAGLQKVEAMPPAQISQPLLTRKFFLLLDYNRNDGEGIAEAKKAALHFIDTGVGPDDEIGVLTYSQMEGLAVHSFLTRDHDKVRRIIAAIKKIPESIKWDFMGTGPVAYTGDETTVHVPFSGGSNPEIEAEKDLARVFASILIEVSKSMKYIPGYKNVVLFSKGQRRLIYQDRLIKEQFENAAKELSAADTHIFSVNTGGLRDFAIGGLKEMGDRSLMSLSKSSGGRYFEDVRKYEKVSDSIDSQTGNYYVLGYYVDEALDGKFHDIQVKVREKGLQVRAQKGYYNPRNFAELSDFEKRMQLIQLALSENPYFQDPVGFSVLTFPCFSGEDNLIFALSRIPTEKMKFNPGKSAEFVTAIFDEANNVVDARHGSLDPAEYGSGRIYVYTGSFLLPGHYEIRVIFRDSHSGRAAVAKAQFTVPEHLEGEIKASSPLYLVPEKGAQFLRFEQSKISAEPKEELSLNRIFPLLPANHAPLIDELDKETSRLIALVRTEHAEGANQEIEIAFELTEEAAGRTSLLNAFILESEKIGDAAQVVLEIELPDLEPGDYFLCLKMSNGQGASRQSLQKFVVK